MQLTWSRGASAALSVALLASCAATEDFHAVLGSTYGWPASELKVLLDIRVGNLQVRHVRWTKGASYEGRKVECSSGFAEHLELNGEIGPDSSEVVERLLGEMNTCVDKKSGIPFSKGVFLNSGGGTLADGYRLGAAFKTHSAEAVVGPGQTCASACAFAFLGAKWRVVDREGYLIFHSPYRQTAGIGIDCSNRGQVSTLRNYIVDSLGKTDGEYVMSRTMDYCSAVDGWSINGDAARVFRITNE